MDEVKLLPCEGVIVQLLCQTLDLSDELLDALEGSGNLQEVARAMLREVRPPIVTDEVVERVARVLTRELGIDPDFTAPAAPEMKMWQLRTDLARAAIAAMPAIPQSLDAFQARVDKWMDACFTPPVKADIQERCDRFIEEALEFIQATGYPASRAHALVDYTFGRPLGEINQEVGGVMVTLAAMCNTLGVDIGAAAETELARVWTKIDVIRAKQAAKPTGSALPIAETPTPSPAIDQDGGEA